MTAAFWLKLYVPTVVIFLVVDLVWLGGVARGFYQNQLGRFLAPQVNWTAAIVFYLLYNVGILIFAVAPGLEANSLGRAALMGALFGFFTYATYDMTNLATLDRWPLTVVVVDVLWGSVLGTLVAAGSFWIGKRLGG